MKAFSLFPSDLRYKLPSVSLRGFTLIELLVTVAIIGILSSVLLVNLQGFRLRTRDTERKKDLLQLQTALELYRADVGTYPTTANYPACNTALANGATVYMQKIPCDPSGSPTWGSAYQYTSTGNTYTLYACLENINDAERDTPTKQGGCASAQASYTVRSP